MSARIYRPAKTAMQSGRGKSKRWCLEFDAESPRAIEPLMGWTSSSDMKSQLKLWFETAEDAVDYAKRNNIAFRMDTAQERKPKSMAYSDNFKFNRQGAWTH
jgi:ETC complex I subunit conserved region